MRRTTAALFGTIAGTALLVGARIGTSPADPAAAGGAAEPGVLEPGAGLAVDPSLEPSPTPTVTGVPTPSVTGPSPSNAPSGTPSRSPSPRKSRSTRTSSPRPAPSRTGSDSGLTNGTFKGASASNEYGTWQVTITVSGGKMTDIQTSYPTSPDRTKSINERAVPKLEQAALSAQSSNVSTVSGATYTTTAFRASLRSALSQADA